MINLNNFIKKFNLVFILIYFFAIFICGCETVKPQYMDADEIPSEKKEIHNGDIVITGIFMKDGKFIDVKNKEVKVDFSNKNYTIIYGGYLAKKDTIAISDINRLKVDVIKNNYSGLIAISVCLAILVTTVILIFTYNHSSWNM